LKSKSAFSWRRKKRAFNSENKSYNENKTKYCTHDMWCLLTDIAALFSVQGFLPWRQSRCCAKMLRYAVLFHPTQNPFSSVP
jgi:hypothetical protein